MEPWKMGGLLLRGGHFPLEQVFEKDNILSWTKWTKNYVSLSFLPLWVSISGATTLPGLRILGGIFFLLGLFFWRGCFHLNCLKSKGSVPLTPDLARLSWWWSSSCQHRIPRVPVESQEFPGVREPKEVMKAGVVGKMWKSLHGGH